MSLCDGLLNEFDHEMVNTRKMLERVPDEKFDWQPHVKSFPLGALAAHIANLPGFIKMMMTTDSFDVATLGGEQPWKKVPTTRQELLELFDANVAAARETLAAAKEEDFMQTWTLFNDGAVIFALPRVAALRTMAMSHLIHHRAQLGLYLRLNDVPVPGMYGPSADEGF